MDNFKKLDDVRVRKFIDWSLEAGKVALTKTSSESNHIIALNYNAWQQLKLVIRGDNQHRYDYDFDAAAAEHYMYIRFLASYTGDPVCYAAPTIYAVSKLFNQLLGNLQSGQAQGGHPVLPSNPYIITWGNKGVIDGLSEYKKANNNASYQPGNAVEALASFSLKKETAKNLGDYAKTNGARMKSQYYPDF